MGGNSFPVPKITAVGASRTCTLRSHLQLSAVQILSKKLWLLFPTEQTCPNSKNSKFHFCCLAS